jgi:hypothetical protein
MVLPPTFSMKSPKASKTSVQKILANVEMLTMTNAMKREAKEMILLTHW